MKRFLISELTDDSVQQMANIILGDGNESVILSRKDLVDLYRVVSHTSVEAERESIRSQILDEMALLGKRYQQLLLTGDMATIQRHLGMRQAMLDIQAALRMENGK